MHSFSQVLTLTNDDCSIPRDIVNVLEAFLKYYKSLIQPTHTITQEDQEALATMQQCQKQLLVHLQVLYPHFDLLLKKDRQRSQKLYQRIHVILNSTIEQLISLDNAAIEFADRTPFLSCRDELICVLGRLLLTEGLPQASVESVFAETAHIVSTVCPTNEPFLRGLLYRHFLQIAYPPAPQRLLRGSKQSHHAPAQLQNLSVSPILTSALKLSVWLYPSVNAQIQWSFYEDFVRHLMNENVDMGPTFKAHRPSPVTTNVLVLTAKEQGIGRYEDMGPSLLWIAGSIHHGGWAEEPDWERIIQLFVGALEGEGRDWTAEGRSCTHREAAGVLFLRAWESSTSAHPDSHSVSRKWTSTAVIKAFKHWISLYQGQTNLEIHIEDAVPVNGSVSHGLIFRFIRHALEMNPSAALGCTLTESVHDLIQMLKARGGSNTQSGDVERWEASFKEVVPDAHRLLEAGDTWSTNRPSRNSVLEPMHEI